MTRQPLRLLIFALAIAAAPLIFTLPLWVLVWLAVCWGYGVLADRRGWAVLPRWMRLGAFALGMAMIIATSGLRFGGDDFIALLAIMAGLKPLEVRSYRDSMITIFLAYFLVITSLFVFENLLMTAYLFVSVWFTTAVLIQVNHPQGSVRTQIRLAGRFVLIAVPLTALMFVLFPRFTGIFWASPWQKQGYPGFARNISIGDVAQLALRDEPAFSATFDKNVPKSSQLYWRGIVFRYFDGRTWYPVYRLADRLVPPEGTQRSLYTVIMEPTGQPYLFVLDLPLEAETSAVIKSDHTLLAHRPIQQRLRYRAVSVLDYQEMPERGVSGRYLQLPEGYNPRALALGKSWGDAYESPERIIKTALAYFQENGFVYSLQPGKLGKNAVDEFLFTTRGGFCEHYASSFTVLMRAAGIPSRMVGGYQGGTWNELGGFLSVRQSDAHVWCEVWLAGQGWVRVDPTAVVSPDRITRGGLDAGLGAARNDGQTFFPVRWYRNLRETWEAINVRWNMWFMSFSAEDQFALLKHLGFSLGRQAQWLLLLAVSCTFIVLLVLIAKIWRLHLSSRTKDRNLKAYKQFLAKMRTVGMPKPLHQGPLAYAEDIIKKFPVLKESVDRITTAYVTLRYSSGSHEIRFKDFNRQIRLFKPKKLLKEKIAD